MGIPFKVRDKLGFRVYGLEASESWQNYFLSSLT